VHLVGYNCVGDITFICLAVVAFQNREITRNSDKIWPYSSSRSSKVIDLGVNRKRRCDFIFVINSNFGVSPTVFEILTFKAGKWLVFPSFPCLMLPLGANSLEFLDETYPTETRGMGLPYVKNFIILSSTVFDWSTRVTDRRADRQTDGRTIAYSALSMLYAVAR